MTAALSLTFDVEMCTNFPYWGSVWDHRKGAIDAETKRYVGKLAEIARETGVRFQWFVLGSSLEDPDVEYLKRLTADGHAVGSHTYHHVNVKAKGWDDLQAVYRSDPALRLRFSSPIAAIRNEIETTSALIRERLGAAPRSFRTPGGFAEGLADAPAVSDLLREHGFRCVSSHYRFPLPATGAGDGAARAEALHWSITHLQPYRYPNGLLEIPMMGLSDIGAFRTLDLERQEWIRLLEGGVDLAAERSLVFSVLMHPCVLACRDPHAASVRRLLERAACRQLPVVTNDDLAGRVG